MKESMGIADARAQDGAHTMNDGTKSQPMPLRTTDLPCRTRIPPSAKGSTDSPLPLTLCLSLFSLSQPSTAANLQLHPRKNATQAYSPPHEPCPPRPQPREASSPLPCRPPRHLLERGTEPLQAGANARCGNEGRSGEGLDGDAEAVALADAEGALAQPVRVGGLLAEGALDDAWHVFS